MYSHGHCGPEEDVIIIFVIVQQLHVCIGNNISSHLAMGDATKERTIKYHQV